MKSYHFDEAHVLHELAHFLPSQTPLKDFIHHNSLHAFQDLEFYEAIFKASKIFGYHVTLSMNEYRKLYQIGRIKEEVLHRILAEYEGRDAAVYKQKLLTESFDSVKDPRVGRLREHWKKVYHFDMDNMVQPLLFRILCSYLDQGIALWHFPFEDKGLINAVRALENNSFTSFFKTKRAKALLFDKQQCTIENLLKIVVGKAEYFEQYLFDQQFSHRGWSGMAATIEVQPHTLLYPKKIALRDVIILELLLEIDNLDYYIGKHWSPLTTHVKEPPLDLFAPVEWNEHNEMLALWQEAFEWSYYDEVLSAVKHLRLSKTDTPYQQTPRSFQSIFCIDERECSIRRHLETVDPECETLGCPGFFGVEFFFQPENGKFYEKLCPAPVTPKYLIKEYDVKEKHKHGEPFHSKKSHTFLEGFLLSLSMGLWAAVRLVLDIFRPKMSPAISDAFAHMNLEGQLTIEHKSQDDQENGLQIGFTVEEMATRVENLLRGIGLVDHFAPLVYVVAHGSSSANNPHHGAHDCGACSGRPGATNARVFAFMANHPKVRSILNTNGLHIPDTTQFLGAMHDTASDELAFYDESILSASNKGNHHRNKIDFDKALDLNAKERSRRFASINTKMELHKVRKAIRQRSVSFFEPRPELGHGTNALCFVGHRQLTQGLFLDRRAFMNSYDYRTDPEGKLLLNVMKPLPPVCGGINLEYYFSRVDQQKMGAGTKLPHNVMGLIGVANSSDGDLRPGLPLQMIEVHDPIRLMIIVEHYPDVVLKTIQLDPDLYAWFSKKWVHLTAIHPDTNEFYYFKKEEFIHYIPIKEEVQLAQDIHDLIESAKEMETNHIVHATQENLPVHIIK